jgi:hypothetical protein
MALWIGKRDRATEQPTLSLGLSGFGPQQRAGLAAMLKRGPAMPRWRIGEFAGADAWWVNSRSVRMLSAGTLSVLPGLPTEEPIKLNLNDVDRPLAFAAGDSSQQFEPLCTFDPSSGTSIQAVLLQFDAWLRMVRAQFALGGQILRRGVEMRHGIYHLSRNGDLLAVLNFQNGDAGLLPTIHPVDILEAEWARRPEGAGNIPHSFEPATIGQLSWAYVRRTARDMLPSHYRAAVIYYRHIPRVPLGWLQDSHLQLLRHLSTEPCTLQSLRRLTGLPADRLELDLACLYYAGAITTTRAKAGLPAPSGFDSQPPSLGLGALEPLSSRDDLTVAGLRLAGLPRAHGQAARATRPGRLGSGAL